MIIIGRLNKGRDVRAERFVRRKEVLIRKMGR